MSEISEVVTRFRSPPYPTLSLQRALERAEQLYRQERDHLAPLPSAAKAWRMSPTSSGPIQVVAALRQYGLIEAEGSNTAKKVRLTHDALRIILDKVPTSENRREAVHKAFLYPKIFLELWERWKSDLPSDQTIINYLVLERRLSNQAPYSEQSASELLANYRASLPFACPQEGSTLPPPDKREEDSEMSADQMTDDQSSQNVRHAQPIKVPVAENERVVFAAEAERNQYFKLVASGEWSEFLLDTLIDFANRQKRRLNPSN